MSRRYGVEFQVNKTKVGGEVINKVKKCGGEQLRFSPGK